MAQAGTIDQQLLSMSGQEKAAGELRQEKKNIEKSFSAIAKEETRQNQRVEEKQKYIILETAKSLGEIITAGNKAAAIEQGTKIGWRLRENISECRFDGGTFYTVLMLSAFKDILDVPGLITLGFSGTLINIAITLALTIVFFMRRSRLKGFIVKQLFRRLWKYFILTYFIEFLPIINFMPSYLIMTFMLKHSVDKKRRKLISQADSFDKELKNLENSA